jgi:alpha-1,3-mannosyltransferase
MRVVHVVRQFHPSVGGLETVVMELACAQLAQGHAVRVVTLDRLFHSNTRKPLASNEKMSGIDVIRIPYRGSIRYPIAPSVLKFVKSADIVHVHAIDFFFDFLAWSKPLHHKPIIASTHGVFFHTSFAKQLKRIYFNIVTRLSAALYDGLVAVSPADQELFAKIARNVICIENGVNIRKYLGASALIPKKAILSIGRFSGNKRLDRLISFVSALRRKDPNWTLIIAGRQADLRAQDITALAERAGLGNFTKIIESPSNDELRRIMKDCSVLASSSEYEGFGLAAVEGMAAGLFPLLSDIPTFRHLVSNSGVGLLVDFSNSDAAVNEFLLRWEQLEKSYDRYREAAIECAQKYDWSLVAASYERIYQKILAVRK